MSKYFNFTIDGKNWQSYGAKTEKWRYSPAQSLLENQQLISAPHLNKAPENLIKLLDDILGDYYLLLGNNDASAEKLPQDIFNFFSANIITPLDKNEGFYHLNEINNPHHQCINVLKSPEKPLVFIYGTDENESSLMACTHPSLRLDIAHNVEITLIEIVVGKHMSNSLLEFDLEKSAKLNHYVLSDLAEDAIHIGDITAKCDESACYQHLSFWQNGAMVRRDTKVALENEHSQCFLNGIATLKNTSNLDNATLIEHQSPNTTASEQFRAILDDSAIHNFQGKIIVQQEAQKTEGYQMSRAMLLSDNARANHKPELEIYADDVRCSHGSTIGAPDKDHLFYLQSRGFSKKKALEFLCKAFLSELINDIADQKIRQLFLHFTGYNIDE